MDEYYYAKIAYKAYMERLHIFFPQDRKRWEELKEFEMEAWKAVAQEMTKEINKYWFKAISKRNGVN